jgi:hypothetical protein
MFGSAHSAIRIPQSLVGLDLRRRYRAPLCRVSAPQLLCLWTTFPGVRALGTSFSSAIGLSTCLERSCMKRGLLWGGTCGWRSAVSPIRQTSRLHTQDRHLVVAMTVTSARTNTNVPHIGARLPLPGSLVLGAQHGKIDADLRTSTLLGTPSVQSSHDYSLLSLRFGGWGPVGASSAELVDRMAIWWLFIASLAWVLQTLVHCVLTVMSACNISFIDLLMLLFDVFRGCAARIHATSFSCSSWYFGFPSSRRFAAGQC